MSKSAFFQSRLATVRLPRTPAQVAELLLDSCAADSTDPTFHEVLETLRAQFPNAERDIDRLWGLCTDLFFINDRLQNDTSIEVSMGASRDINKAKQLTHDIERGVLQLYKAMKSYDRR